MNNRNNYDVRAAETDAIRFIATKKSDLITAELTLAAAEAIKLKLLQKLTTLIKINYSD